MGYFQHGHRKRLIVPETTARARLKDVETPAHKNTRAVEIADAMRFVVFTYAVA